MAWLLSTLLFSHFYFFRFVYCLCSLLWIFGKWKAALPLFFSTWVSFIFCCSNFWKLLTFQKRDDARQFMKFLHPDLGVGNALKCLWIVNLACQLIDTFLVEVPKLIGISKFLYSWMGKLGNRQLVDFFLICFYWWYAELPERSYGSDCRIYLPENPTSRFKNVYVWFLLWQPINFIHFLILPRI